jgi:hypothetical protein
LYRECGDGSVKIAKEAKKVEKAGAAHVQAICSSGTFLGAQFPICICQQLAFRADHL